MLILASTSPYRKALLERLNLPFECIAPHVDEQRLEKEPIDAMVQRLSRLKAEAVAKHYPHHFVIGSDQSAEIEGVQLTKPGNYARAYRQLKQLSGKRVQFHTGLCVCHQGQTLCHLDTSTTLFRQLDDSLIHHYLEQEHPYQCAGGIKSEGLGALLIERIDNQDPNALIGLPLLKLVDLLHALHYPFPWQQST